MADKLEQAKGSSAFISYSRKNIEFVRKLNDGLDASGVKAWVDWEGIPPSSDWMQEITAAIQSADAFIFVISPDSLASKVCGDELVLGLKYDKKLIPVLHIEPEKGTVLPEKIAATNWIYMRAQDDFKAALPKILDSINTDLEWVQQHTRLLQRATEWEAKKKNPSFLIQGTELEEAQHWLTESTSNANRVVAPLQAEYITASRTNATRRQRNLLIGVSLALVVSIALGIMALYQSGVAKTQKGYAENSAKTAVANANLAATNENKAIANEHIAATAQSVAQTNEMQAKKNEITAKSQRSAALAQIYQNQPGELNISTLLAIDSWQREQSYQTEDILRQNISLLPQPAVLLAKIPTLVHNGLIEQIRFNHDGTRFVTASDDQSACVWNLAASEKQFCVSHDDKVIEALFLNDGQTLLTASVDGTVDLWDATNGSLKQQFDLKAPINAIDISPNGDYIAVAETDQRLSIIRLSANMVIATLRPPDDPVVVTFSPDGQWLAVGTQKGNVLLWRLMTELWLTFPSHNGEVFDIKFSPDGKWLVSGGADKTARVSLAGNGEQKFVLTHGDWVETIAFSPDSSWFVAGSDDYNAWAWNTGNGRERFRMQHQGFVQNVQIDPDGEWIATCSHDKTARIWDAASGVEMQEISLAAECSGLAFSPDGNLLVTGDSAGNIMIWDNSALAKRVGYLEFPELTHEAHFSPSGAWLVANTDDKRVWLFGTDTLLSTHNNNTARTVLRADALTYAMEVSPDSNWIAVNEDHHRVLLTRTLLNNQIVLDNGSDVTGFSFSPNSQQLAVSSSSGTITIWDIASAQVTATIANNNPIYSIGFSPDGKWLATGSTDQTVIWDLAQAKQIATLPQPGQIGVLDISHDGTFLATASADGSTRIWLAGDGSFQQKYNILGNTHSESLDFSPDNKFLALGSEERFLYLIDLATGEEVARIPHSDKVTGVSFSNDGTLLASVSNKVVHIWKVSNIPLVRIKDIVPIACSHLTSNLDEATWSLLFHGDPYQATCPTLGK